jgi:DNA polymerase III epsilon subunit-like protein
MEVMKQNLEKIYCSLDIETTGFDPLKEEILEVGFAFFKVSDKGLKITEEWTQVFKPTKEVSPQILGLTGISKQEIENAPTFAELREFIQNKIGDAVIVGHNIIFDIKFLEAFGIKFSGQSIDTLDLVQWLLPTHHSYNLENLMHTFGISHKDAHRALADSKATIKLLEKLLQIFIGFPETLKSKILKLIKRYNFSWANLLEFNYEPINFNIVTESDKRNKNISKLKELEFKNKFLYNFSLQSKMVEDVACRLTNKNVLLVVPKVQTVLDLQKTNLFTEALFSPENLFDPKKVKALEKTKNLSVDTIKFLLKIYVWQETNWQTKTLLDLNLSFFGGQFKNLVSGPTSAVKTPIKRGVCDMVTFMNLASDSNLLPKSVVICGLNEFENSITSDISTKASWGYINYVLKGLYNSELNIGNPDFREPVEELLAASDLFFALVNMLLKNESEAFAYFKVSEAVINDERWNKIILAAENFTAKLLNLNKILKSTEIEKFAINLNTFFKHEENRVKWVELAENRCVFFSMPLDISAIVNNTLNKFDSVTFADTLDNKILPEFFLKRLGLLDYKVESVFGDKKPKINSEQGDLFKGFKKLLTVQNGINFHYLDKAAQESDILNILKANKFWPAAILFPSPLQVKEFYQNNFESLKKDVSVLAQTSYGGSNKLFRNFSINKKSLMLVSDKFILKNLNSNSNVEQVSKINVKTLIICRLPFEQFTHPYQEALSAFVPNAFTDFALPKALYNLHSIIKLFYTQELKNVYIIDAKLSKPYAEVFTSYWKSIPGAKI